MKLILVTGPWSSGTSAVAGMLEALGVDGCGPYFRTNDQRTPNSFESLAFRAAVDSVASVEPLALSVRPKEAFEAMQLFRSRLEAANPGADPKAPIFLKYPLSALLIPQMARVFELKLVYVLRPLRDIEATRQRRGWVESFGAKGAQVIYARMFEVMIEMAVPTMVIRYPDLLKSPAGFTATLARFAQVQGDVQERLRAANSFVRGRQGS